MIRPLFCLLLVGICSCGLSQSRTTAKEPEGHIPRALFDYLDRDEKVFDWKLNGKQELEQGMVYDLDLTSQQWHEIVWKHALTVCEPKQLLYPKHVLLFV